MKTAGKLFMIIYRTITWLVIAAAVLLAVLFFIGIRPYAVRTGSMEPLIPEGSLCFVNQRVPYEEVRRDDIIAFKVNEMLVTHRAVDVSAEGITTKGDANNNTDAARVTTVNYIGKSIFWIPLIGRIPLFAQTVVGKIVLIGIFAAFILTGIVYDRVAASKRKKENCDAAVSGD